MGPEVVVGRRVVLGLPGLDPAHLDGMDQLGDLWGRARSSPGATGPHRLGEEEEVWGVRMEPTAAKPSSVAPRARGLRSVGRRGTGLDMKRGSGNGRGSGWATAGTRGAAGQETSPQRCHLCGGSSRTQGLALRSQLSPGCRQTSHLLLLDEGGDEAPLVRRAVRHRVDHDLVGEEVNGRLGRHRPVWQRPPRPPCPSRGRPAPCRDQTS